MQSNDPDKAPETISKAVASLPPEQMFELLKQMKQCVQNNPREANNMLLQNPQLAYALLQALVVMRIVDPQIAFTALNSTNATNSTSANNSSENPAQTNFSASSMINRAAAVTTNDIKPVPKPVPPVTTTVSTSANTRPYVTQPTPPPAPSIPVSVVPPPPPIVHEKIVPNLDKVKTEGNKRDPRLQHQAESKDSKAGIPRMVPPPAVPVPPPVSVPHPANAPSITSNPNRPATPVTSSASASTAQSTTSKPAVTSNTPDNEKAALIMQVLRLTDAQIAMLPPEQRQSIILLKEQIAKSTKR